PLLGLLDSARLRANGQHRPPGSHPIDGHLETIAGATRKQRKIMLNDRSQLRSGLELLVTSGRSWRIREARARVVWLAIGDLTRSDLVGTCWRCDAQDRLF